MTKNVLILGATGLVGRNLVKACCASQSIRLVKIFVRKNLSDEEKIKLFGTLEKIEEHLIDFNFLSNSVNHITGDILFSALGSTMKQAKSKENFFRIDHDYNFAFAKLARTNGVKTVGLVSSIGANKDGPSFYLKTKGLLEQNLAGLNFQKFIVVRPSFLIGSRGEQRLSEKMGIGFFQALRPVMFGGLKKFAPIDACEVAQTLLELALTDKELNTNLEYDCKVKEGCL